jgi:cytochrome bd-type quinol oxidase subunit 2
MKESFKSQYLWALFFLGIFLLNYPVLNLYNIQERWADIPVLYIFIFFFWTLLIALTLLIIKKTDKQ